MVLNNLISHVLRNVNVRQFGGDISINSLEPETHKNEFLLQDAVNVNRYTFFVTITAFFPVLPENDSNAIDQNVFIIKKLSKFVSSMEDAKETVSVVIFDRSNNIQTSVAFEDLSKDIKTFIIDNTKLTCIQETEIFRVLNVNRKVAIAIIERNSINDFQIMNTVTHNILKTDNQPPWPWNFSDTRILYNAPVVKPNCGELVEYTNVYNKAWRYKAVFFFNWMIPLCRSFANTLRLFYESIIKQFNAYHLEIFGVMFDYDKYENEVVTMPWYTVKLPREKLELIKYAFGVSHVPSLVLLDENDDIVTRNGRALIVADPIGASFGWNQWLWDSEADVPWKGARPWNYYLIFEVPSLVIFGDSEDEPFIDSVIEAVGKMQSIRIQRHLLKTKNVDIFNHQKLNRNQFISGSTILMHKSIDDEDFLDRFGLIDLSVPLALIIDPYLGVFVCNETDMSPDIVKKFVTEFQLGHLQPYSHALPPTSKRISSPTSMAKTTHSLDPLELEYKTK